ncbi:MULTISPECIES: terpene synthase family protein [Burkholderia]|uniref:terpene synthase family protein n=1 Tax=Burkholderia TaxID=32008 RepID=UPI0010501B3C|nr:MULTISPECIES: terpene cyclase [Burkholderia]TDA49089.1 terpene cyclase [Burkholderia pyrrocinia]
MNIASDIDKVPAIYWPFSVNSHPRIEEVHVGSVAFMDRFSLYEDREQRDRLEIGRVGGGLTGLLYPSGPLELAQIAADWSMVVFAFDDYYCDEGPTRNDPETLVQAVSRIHRAIEAPEYIEDPNDNYALAFRDIRIRLEHFGPPELIYQWVDAVKGWYLLEVVKASNIARGVKPSLSDGANLRLQCGGGFAYIGLIPIVRQIPVSIRMLADRRVRALSEMANMIVNWGGEVYSYFKEAHRAYDDHNMIDVVRNTYRCDKEEALVLSNRHYEQIVRRFIELRLEVLAGTSDPALASYLDALIDYAGGGLYWCQTTLRHIFRDTFRDSGKAYEHDGFTDVAKGGAAALPVVPSLAWWWHVGESSMR